MKIFYNLFLEKQDFQKVWIKFPEITRLQVFAIITPDHLL